MFQQELLVILMSLLCLRTVYARTALPVCTLGEELCQLPCGPCNTRAFIYESEQAALDLVDVQSSENTTRITFQLTMARDAWSRRCPMLSVAVRTRVDAMLLPDVGPAPSPRHHTGCSPALGLKRSIEWVLPPAAEDGFQPERQSLVAVFAGELPAELLLKKASRMRVLTARGEAIDIHYPPEPAFFYVVSNRCYCSHGFMPVERAEPPAEGLEPAVDLESALDS